VKRDIRALIVEDSEDDTTLLLLELQRGGYSVHHSRVDSNRSLTEALDQGKWDIVLSDYSLPGFSGTKALSIIRDRDLELPFIFVSGTMGEDTAVTALKAGAQDYIMKNNLKRLLPAINRELRELERRRKQRRNEEETHLLQSIAQMVNVAADVEAAMEITMDKIFELANWSLVQVWIPNSAGTLLECSSTYRCRDKNLEILRMMSVSDTVTLGEDLPGRVWLSKQPVCIPDVTCAPDFPRTNMANAIVDDTVALGIPVLTDDEAIAVFELFIPVAQRPNEQLVQFISAVAAQLGEVIQRRHAEERLQYLAHYDTLTGLPNRVLFTDRLRRALVDANRHERFVGVIFVDLDRFKAVNDNLGHRAGDHFLQAIAERIRQCVRQGDTVSRLAGDEFTLILADMKNPEAAARVAQVILDKLGLPFYVDGHELYTNVSLGITVYPFDENDVDGLLRNADIAMYRAKERGGNTYEFYSSEMTFNAQNRLGLENSLRHAMSEDEFELHYLPVVGLGNGQIQSVEALIRWRQADNHLVMPGKFIPLAEETGLIVSIGEWVLRTACEEYQGGEHGVKKNVRLAINVSPRQFGNGQIINVVTKVLQETGFDPNNLEIEITENLLLHNADTAMGILRKLAALGVRFTIDDFGTGYSSIGHLKSLPISDVKIDRSFVNGLPDNANDAAIVSAIISMAHNMGLKVVAEGVETAEQLEFLRERDCDAMQGYYFSAPVPHETICRYFDENKALMAADY